MGMWRRFAYKKIGPQIDNVIGEAASDYRMVRNALLREAGNAT